MLPLVAGEQPVLFALSESDALFQLGLVFVLGIAAQLIAPRLNLPSIVLLLVFGFGAGAVGALDPDELLGDLIGPIVSLATGIVLFEGGLKLSFRGLGSRYRRVVIASVTLGAAVTGALAAVAAEFRFDLPWDIAILVGAILVVTGPTVVGPLLDFIRPSKPVDTVLRWEGALIDPIGAILGVLVYQAVLTGSFSAGSAVGSFLGALGVGVAFGLAGAAVLLLLIRLLSLSESQTIAAALMVVLATVTVADIVSDDAGLLSALIMGMVLANGYLDPRRREGARGSTIEFTKSVRRFNEGIGSLTSLLIGTLFIILSARVSPQDIADLDVFLPLYVGFLVLVGRPVSVALWTARSSLSLRERAFIGWMAPRGIIAAATSASFALGLEGAQVPDAEKIIPITFVAIVGTAVVYGLTGRPVAQRLGVARGGPAAVLVCGANEVALHTARALGEAGVQTLVAPLGQELAADAGGLELYSGDLLVDLESPEPTDLDGVGTILLMSASDELNSVLAVDLASTRAGERVFQLAPDEPGGEERSGFFERAAILFDRDATFPELERRLAAGESMGEHAPPGLLLFAIVPGKQLDVATAEAPLRRRDGQVVVSLG